MSLKIYLVKRICDKCGRGDEVFEANITHNLTKMAKEAGIYEIVWRPEKNSITRAFHLVKPLRKAIEEMKADPERFKKYNAKNGYGSYENFVPWLESYLAACEADPAAGVFAER